MMIVRCPACQTTFRARPEHLAARAGRVRCGHCYTPFNALENLVDSPAAEEIGKPRPSAIAQPEEQAVAESQSTAPETIDVPQESAAPSSPDRADTAHDLDERLALALSPSNEIDRHLSRGDRIQAYDEDLDLYEAFTDPPDLSPDDGAIEHDIGVAPAPAAHKPDTGDALRWSPARKPSVHSPASLSNAVWPTLIAQPPEPDTIQPDVFPARESDSEAPPEGNQAADGSSHVRPPERDAPAPTLITTDPDDRPWRQVTHERREPAFAPRATAALDTTEEYNPDFTRYARGETQGRVWLWALMVGVLLGSLAVQSTYVFRVELARQWPQLRPVFLELCDRLGCDMPLPRNPQAIHVTASNLESDPNDPTSFVLHARLRNDAPYLQAYPHLEITLTDARDRPAARRVLEPEEWLPTGAIESGFGGQSELEMRLPFSAPELTNATGYRLYAFFP